MNHGAVLAPLDVPAVEVEPADAELEPAAEVLCAAATDDELAPTPDVESMLEEASADEVLDVVCPPDVMDRLVEFAEEDAEPHPSHIPNLAPPSSQTWTPSPPPTHAHACCVPGMHDALAPEEEDELPPPMVALHATAIAKLAMALAESPALKELSFAVVSIIFNSAILETWVTAA